MDENNINEINAENTPQDNGQINEPIEEAVASEVTEESATTSEAATEQASKEAMPEVSVPEESAIEEQVAPVLDSCESKPAEPAAYAFRWDYNTQKSYDGAVKTASKPSKGVLTYAIILTVTLLASIAVLVGAIIFGDSISLTPAKEQMQFSDELALDQLYDYCLPSYVAISVVGDKGTSGYGSGIVITEDGYISTNYHVVEGAKKITVITSNGTKHDATYIDGDEINDIAVIKVSGKKFTPAVLGSSSQTKVGERVMAIGTPYSISYAGSMTAGYVSGIEREYQVMNDNGTVNKTLKLIQTDTSVNPGNSGGPLFNMNGEVIGIVTLKIAGANYEGMGFAIPIDGAKKMIFDIIENGKITNADLGSAVKGAALGITGRLVEGDKKYLMTADYCIEVQTDDLGDYIEWSIGLSKEKIYVTDTETLDAVGLDGAYPYHAPCTGILVKTTSKGFDSNEKLNVEDVIISANGVVCDTMTVLQEMIYASRIGDVLELEIFRDGGYMFVNVELGAANSME